MWIIDNCLARAFDLEATLFHAAVNRSALGNGRTKGGMAVPSSPSTSPPLYDSPLQPIHPLLGKGHLAGNLAAGTGTRMEDAPPAHRHPTALESSTAHAAIWLSERLVGGDCLVQLSSMCAIGVWDRAGVSVSVSVSASVGAPPMPAVVHAPQRSLDRRRHVELAAGRWTASDAVSDAASDVASVSAPSMVEPPERSTPRARTCMQLRLCSTHVQKSGTAHCGLLE